MSGGVTGPGSGADRLAGLEPSDPAKTDALVAELKASSNGSGPRWLSFLDSDSTTKKLAEKLLADGKIDANDAKALVKDAKDYGKITKEEKNIFAGLLRDHAAQMTPDARDALAKFFDLPIGRPAPAAGAFPGRMKALGGTREYS